MKLRRLIVHRFRQVAPGTVLDLEAAVVAVLGRNGAGKTTLLELLALAVSWDFSPLKDEEFDVEFGITVTGADRRAHALALRVRQSSPAADPLAARARPHWWTYSLGAEDGDWHLEAQPHGNATLSFGGSKRPVLAESPFESNFLFAALSELNLATAPPSLSAAWEASFRLGLPRFDEELGAYWALKGQTEIPKTSWGLRAPPLTALMTGSPKGSTTTMSSFRWGFGDSTLETDRLRTGALSFDASELPELRRVCGVLGFDDARLHLQLIDADALDGGSVRAQKWGNLTVQLRRNRSLKSDVLLSYGQRRLLSLLLWIYGARDLVLIDELTNGLHHDWIQGVLDAIGDRQAILATQSPLLLDFLEFDSADAVRRGLVFCSEQDGLMTWKNPTSEEADMVWRGIQAGIQHVSEVLRTRGLW